jgi:hypothetical protein
MEADLEEPISIIFPVAVTLQNESERISPLKDASLPGFSPWLRSRKRFGSFDGSDSVHFDCVAFLLSLDVVILFVTFHIMSWLADVWVQVYAGPACQGQRFGLVSVARAHRSYVRVEWWFARRAFLAFDSF